MLTRYVLPVVGVVTVVLSFLFYDAVARLVLLAGYGLLGLTGTVRFASVSLAVGFWPKRCGCSALTGLRPRNKPTC